MSARSGITADRDEFRRTFKTRTIAACDASAARQFAPFAMYCQRGATEAAHYLGKAMTLQEAEAEAVLSLQHKDTLLIYENDERFQRRMLHAFKVRQGAAQWRRNEQTGLSERWHPLKLDALFSLPVDDFAPKRPFDAFRDDPVGHDFSMIEGDAA